MRVFGNSIFIQQSRIVLSSTLALSFCIALVFLLVLTEQFQGASSRTEKHMRGQRMRHSIASREGRASSVKTLGQGRVSCTRARLSRLNV